MTESEWWTPQDVARLSGFSDSFIRAEIKCGALPALFIVSPSKPRTRGRWRIARLDALTYLKTLGIPSRTERTQHTDE